MKTPFCERSEAIPWHKDSPTRLLRPERKRLIRFAKDAEVVRTSVGVLTIRNRVALRDQTLRVFGHQSIDFSKLALNIAFEGSDRTVAVLSNLGCVPLKPRLQNTRTGRLRGADREYAHSAQ